MKLTLPFIFMALLLITCNNPSTQEIRDKETYLSQKEYELILKEQLLDIREDRLIKAGLDQKIVFSTDTGLVNKHITGLWSVEQNCIQAGCQTSVVGDRKNEQWEIFYKENVLIAKAMESGKLVRYYVGNYSDKFIEMTYDRKEGTAEKPAAKMVVTLRPTGENRMEGQREIHRNGCIVIYNLVLKKQ